MSISLEAHLNKLLGLLPKPARELHELVGETLRQCSSSSTTPPELQKTQWELLLRKTVFDLAETESTALRDPQTRYYDQMRDKLDLVLAFTDHEAVGPGVPLTIIEDLLETQTVSSCTRIFGYLQTHSARLTKGLVPNRGPALTLLRSLNDLLRRLSKTGQSSSSSGGGDVLAFSSSSSLGNESSGGAAFCGRILCFLSEVFHLTERSGVNLRGEYGGAWDGPGVEVFDHDVAPNVTSKGVGENENKTEADQKMEDAQTQGEAEKQEDLFITFWSLQTLFAKPSLFSHSPPLGQPSIFNRFKQAVDKTLPVIREANVRDRAVMGSRVSSSSASTTSTSKGSHNGSSHPNLLKRKKDTSGDDSDIALLEQGEDYFFAKFLTSPELLELELADPLFRRQFLTQLLILSTHLLTFTKAAKTVWATPRNRSMQMDFTLEPDDERFCMSTVSDCYTELKSTYPSGTAFSQSVKAILEREKNWIKWKNELCPDFRKLPAYFELQDADSPDQAKVTMEEATKQFRLASVNPPKWPHKYGTEPLTEIWVMGYRGLSDLESSFNPGDPRSFLKKIKLEDMKIERRQKALDQQAAVKRARLEELTRKKEEEEAKLKASPMDVDETAATTPALPPAFGEATQTTTTLPPSVPPKPVLNVPEPQPRASTPQATKTTDDVIARAMETKDRWTWLALRAARDTHLKYFATNGTGDIEQLIRDADNPLWGRKEEGKEGSESNGKEGGKTDGKDGTTPMPSGGAEQSGVMKDSDGWWHSVKDKDSQSSEMNDPPTTSDKMQVDKPEAV